jgi:hypothetical protein
MTPEQGLKAIYSFAGQQMRDGIAPTVIEKTLIERGLDVDAAAVVVSNLMQAKVKALKNAGRKNMLYGALWCIGGIVVTALSYQQQRTLAASTSWLGGRSSSAVSSSSVA